jgi:hypothetical protein
VSNNYELHIKFFNNKWLLGRVVEITGGNSRGEYTQAEIRLEASENEVAIATSESLCADMVANDIFVRSATLYRMEKNRATGKINDYCRIWELKPLQDAAIEGQIPFNYGEAQPVPFEMPDEKAWSRSVIGGRL